MEKRYLKNYEFNNVKVLNELAKIVENNNGEVIYNSYMHELEYENRSYFSILNETKIRLAKLEEVENNNPGTNEKRLAAIAKYKNDIIELENSKPANIKSKLSSYIKFKIDNIYYYLQLNDNPFMEDLYNKIKVDNNGCYYGVYYIEELNKKDRIFDCLLTYTCSDEDIKEIANITYNMLLNAGYSKKSYIRKRVNNTWNNSYHYENVAENGNKKNNIYN